MDLIDSEEEIIKIGISSASDTPPTTPIINPDVEPITPDALPKIKRRGRPKQPPKEKPIPRPVGRPKQPPKPEKKGHFWERKEEDLNKLEKARMSRYKKLLEKVNLYDNLTSDNNLNKIKEADEKGKKEQFEKELIVNEVLEKLKLEKTPQQKTLKMIDERGDIRIIKF
jgi:hypothetical protein